VLDVTDEDRLEPVLGAAGAPITESWREPIFSVTPAEAGAHGSMGPGLRREDRNDGPRSPGASEREPQVEKQRRWVRLRGPVGSLLLHLLPLLLLIDWQFSPPAETAPVTVQLVMEPPPPPAPEVKTPPPVPQPKPTPPPPRGRVASEDLGEPEAKQVDKPKVDPPSPVRLLPQG
jgi:hypothetical protein